MKTQWTEPRLFDLPPASYPQLQVKVSVNLDGPRGTSEVWVEIKDLVKGERIALWSNPLTSVFTAPECASEILADAVRTAMRDLAPFG